MDSAFVLKFQQIWEIDRRSLQHYGAFSFYSYYIYTYNSSKNEE